MRSRRVVTDDMSQYQGIHFKFTIPISFSTFAQIFEAIPVIQSIVLTRSDINR